MHGEAENDELIMTLVESVLGRPPEERSRYLRSACRDSEMYDEVWKRVEWDERMGSFLCEPLVERQTVERPFEPGTLLADRFLVIREVGAGGMGVVYEAIDEKLERRVAIKCSKAGHHNRLPPEARAAREVSHFNVCKVHDLHVAATPQGEVEFLSMEFIDGETLTERMRREPALTEAEVREIALQVCSGLAQAHRQGVIHGDIKGANIILARSREGDLRAVVTDFGLAKLALGEGGDIASEWGGTLDYMAPELFLGAEPSVATDLYALGVLFHRMLKGRTPARLSPPPVPEPTRIGGAGTRASTVTMTQPVVGAGWERQIDDLPSPWDRIVKRCLAPRPEDRYASVDQVLEVFKPRRLVMKWVVAAMVVLVAGLALGLWQALRERPAGPAVRLAVLPVSVDGEAIKTAAGIANDVADRLSGLRRNFIVIPPVEAQRNPVKDLQEAKSILGATHAFQIRLHNSSGRISAEASIVDTASGETLRELHGSYAADDTPGIAKALVATATGTFHLRPGVPRETVAAPAYSYYVQGVALMRRDDTSAAEAMPYFDKAIELDPRSALPYAGLAETQLQKYSAGYGHQWLDLAGQTVAKARSLNPDSVPVLLIAGLLKQNQGSYEQAVRDFSRATELDANNADGWLRLAGVYKAANRPEEAVAAYQKAIEIQPGYYLHYLNFGEFYWNRGEYKKAEEQYRRVTAVAPKLEHGHSSVGLVLMDQGRYREAEQEMLTALQLRETRRILNNLGALYNYEGRDKDAIGFYERALEIGPRSILLYTNLGDTYRRLGRIRESDKAYRDGRTMAEVKVVDNPRDANNRAILAYFCARLGDRARAEFEIAQTLRAEVTDAKVLRFAAFTYEVLKQRDKTIEILRNAPAYLLNELNRHPDLRELQRDPRFVALVEQRKIQ